MSKTFRAAVALVLLAAAFVGWQTRQPFPYYTTNEPVPLRIAAHVHCFPHVQWSTEDWLPRFSNEYRDAFGHKGLYLCVLIARSEQYELEIRDLAR